METFSIEDFFRNLASDYTLQFAVSVSLVLIYFLIAAVTKPRFEEGADHGRFKENAASDAFNLIRVFYIIFALLVMALIWGLDFRSVVIFATTTLTLLGVALFASWSILSNVTAYFVLLMHPSFRRGTFIRVFDIDNYVEGYIAELSPFTTRLLTENREVILYPNNMLLSRPSLINPRDRLDGVGKITAMSSSEPEPPATGS